MRHCARERGYGPIVVLDGLALSLLSILVGLYVGLLRGGLVRNLALTRVEWPWMLVVGVVLPVLVDRTDPPHGVPLVVVGLLALIAFARRNAHLVGMGVVTIGVLCNLAVVVLNGGMPVRAKALVDAGLAQAHEVSRVEIPGVQRLEREGDVLLALADIVPLPETRQVLSFGDLIIVVGLADVAANLLLRRERTSSEDEDDGHGDDRRRAPVARPARAPRPRATSASRAPRTRHIPEFEPITLDDDVAPVLVGALPSLD